ncbi:MAG TPA: FG-GAP-like repeat-containing protein [Polyangia bacterium]|jgi:RHS repeat-associated protein
MRTDIERSGRHAMPGTRSRTRVAIVICGALVAGAGSARAEGSDTQVDAFTGRFTTSVPIGVPPFRGLEPAVALQYSSSAVNGFVGLGWSLAAGSTINRVSSSRGAPRFDATDLYLLDGQELVPCTTLGGTHCTRIQSYERITWDAGASRWYVWSKDGTKRTYERVAVQHKGTLMWGLVSRADTRGNTVNYKWWCDPATTECYLDAITYLPGTAQTTCYDTCWDTCWNPYEAPANYDCNRHDCNPHPCADGARITFYREARSDVVRRAAGQWLVSMSYRLKTIDVQVAGVRARAYGLGYGTTEYTSQSRLTSVTQYGADASVDASGTITAGSRLPPMTLGYDPERGAAFTTVTSTAWCNVTPQPADFDGDGRTDLLCQQSGVTIVGYSNGDGTFRPVSLTGFCSGAVVTGDVNGDGRADLVCHDGNVVKVALSTGRGFQIASPWASFCATAPQLGDFDGDGKQDLLCLDGAGLAVARSNGDGTFRAIALGTWCPAGSSLATADFDGDGRADLLCQTTGGSWQVALSKGDSTFPPGYGSSCSVGVQIADFNGDSKADVRCPDSGIAPTYLSQGDGTFTAIQSTPNTAGATLGDFNGDGRTDLFTHWSTSAGEEVGYVYFVHADGTLGTSTPVNGTSYLFNWKCSGGPLVVGDYNGDGLADLYCLSGNRVALSTGGTMSLLTSMSNGLGGQTTINYAPSSTWHATYLPEGLILPTVSSVTIADGRGDVQATNYTYDGALWSAPDREFLGFRKVTSTLAATGAYSETYYWQRTGTIAKPEVIYKRKAGGAIVSFEKFRFTESASAPYSSLVTEIWAYECNGDGVVDASNNYVSGCRRVLATYAWDVYGNMTTENQYGDYDVTGDERTAVHAFSANTAAYLVGLPAADLLYAGIGTAGPLMTRALFHYDGATAESTPPVTGALTRKAVWYDQTGGYVSHTFGYDAYGNETVVTDPLGFVTTKEFDPSYHVFTTATVNALGHRVEISYDPVRGHPTSRSDADGNVTTYTYSALGQVTEIVGPDGARTKFEHLDYGNPSLQRIRQSVWLPGVGYVWDDNYFDGLGREYKKVSQTGVTQETIFGASGKASRKSLPYVSGETPRYDEFTYDELGRQLTVKRPDGATVSQSYGDGVATTTDARGGTRTVWRDPYGRQTKVREVSNGVAQDTTWAYDVLGRRTRSVDPLGNVTAVVYDSLGRVLQKSDPDQGLWRYEYDPLGRLTAETDALGQRATLTLDPLGRVVQRRYADGTWDSFVFDESGRGASKGRLTTATSACDAASPAACALTANSVVSRLGYDVAGRRTAFGQTLGGKTCLIGHTYDAAGRMVTAAYPDGEVVTYTYGTAGLALGRLVGVSGVLTDATYDARGQMRTLTYANGVTTTVTPDAYGERPVQLQIGALATINYGYDLSGQVTSMASPQLGLTNWAYGYDALGRLTQATNTADASKSQSFGFDALGRMTASSAKGAYVYGSAAHPHAVTAAGADTYTYDANGNMVSGAGRTITYDLDHKPVSITSGSLTTSFVYDALGNRVKKASASGTVEYVGALYEKRPGGATRYYFAGAMRLAKRDASGLSFFHTDHLGSTRLITNAAGQEVKRYEYAPFGQVLSETGAAGDSHRFTGQEGDDETGLMFYRARYYDPALGRFLQPDAFLPAANSPQALDVYAYANNSPINYVDPSGHAPLAVAAIVALVGCSAMTATVIIVATTVIGVALTFTNNKVLQSIGMVMAGVGAACMGGPLAGLGYSVGGMYATMAVAAVVALAQSPISPLDPTVKKAIGWAYAVWGGVSTIYEGASVEYNIAPSFRDYLECTVNAAAWEVGATGLALAAAYLVSMWGGPDTRYAFAFVGRCLTMGMSTTPGPLQMIGLTYDLAYTLKHPDGRVVDLSGGEGGESFEFIYHTGYESGSAMGRQHIRVWDQQRSGYWEIGDRTTGLLGPGIGFGGWIGTQKITVIMKPTDAAVFRAALAKGATGTTGYVGYHRDSYVYISAALQYATGKSAADLHINPGLINW